MATPVSALAGILADGRRLHLQHGPIDLVIEAWGGRDEVDAAYAQARACFADVLPALCAELPRLRREVDDVPFAGPVAERMRRACLSALTPGPVRFLTPMAAVAGAVADHVLAAMIAGRDLAKAYVNDGGDIAFHLPPGSTLRCGLVADLAAPALDGAFALTHDLPVRGLATSGRATKGSGGRSFSLGIADAVTVLATSASRADAAATVVANAVDVDDPRIVRRPASAVRDGSDLGDRLVTCAVPSLPETLVAQALENGERAARREIAAGRIIAALLCLQGRAVACGTNALLKETCP